jgi:hypothetical protein
VGCAVTELAYNANSPFEVQDTPEFQRVLNLRRRVWEEEIQVNNLCARMTAAFKIPDGKQELRLIQAAALADAHDLRGLLAPIRVGEGKTLLTFLLPMVVPGIQRPTLLLPAGLVEKTWREFQVLKQHWLCHISYMTRAMFDECVITYEKLGRDSGKDALMGRRPDMVIADEVHYLRNREAACTRRAERFMIANSETLFCGMSGSITKRSIRDYWHLAYWALREGMPLPRVKEEMEKWAEAVDEKKTDAIARRDPGVLLSFCTDEEREVAKPTRDAPVGRTAQMPIMHFRKKLAVARTGYRRRFNETPGVISSPDKNLDCSLIIRRCDVDPGKKAQEHLATLRETWTTPNGDEVAMPVDVWRHARELACGFYYRWEPAPPGHWVAARKLWNWCVRQILSPEGEMHEDHSHLHLDSPMQVGLAISDGRITHPHVLAAHKQWQDVKNDYKINVVAEWVDDSTLKYCMDWTKANPAGIVWTEHRAFGHRLAQMMGTGFCSSGGEDENGRPIEDYKGAPVVASVQANAEGRNLQAWHRNLIVTAPPTGSLYEQLLGRTHRPGQEADTVFVDWISACDEQEQGFQQVLADAQYIQDTTGQSQKLLYADRI